MDIDIQTIHTVHFVGIKGVAMTSLALYCKEKGMMVTGSDVSDDFPTKEVLDSSHIKVLAGFLEDHISSLERRPDIVIYTGAHGGAGNPEVKRALEMGIPCIAHGKALGLFMDDSIQVSVAGSHGKTTTSAMIATILHVARLDPSYAIGCGSLRPIGNPGHCGRGKIFVAEADEYLTDPQFDKTPRFFWQKPDIFVVTNIDFDHPDAYGSIEEVKKAFLSVQKNERGKMRTIVNADDENSSILLHPEKGSVETYGTNAHAEYQVSNICTENGYTVFDIAEKGTKIGSFRVAVPGVHNALNATAAAIASRHLGLSWEDIRKGLSVFAGTKRRFEMIGKKHGITIVDDYAHHPKEIETTLSAAKSFFPDKRIITVFQPHTYSRTRALLTDFVKSFTLSNIVVIADIYASAREKKDETMTAEFFVKEMLQVHQSVHLKKTYNDTEAYLDEIGKDGDVILFLGAGDIASWASRYFDHVGKTV